MGSVHDMESAIIRYTRAFDERDMNTAYMKLWGVLEFLTGTSKNQGYVTAKRVASLYKFRDFHLVALKILKEFRNSYIHHGKEMNDLGVYLNQLKNYVETLIHFHTTNQFNFKSIAKVAEFFDLPVNEAELWMKLLQDQYGNIKSSVIQRSPTRQ